MIGADVEALRRLAHQFDQSAERLRAQAGQVGNAVAVSAWAGPVAVRFRAGWDSEHSVALRSAAETLQGNAKVLRAQAAAQESASAAVSVTSHGGRLRGGGGTKGLVGPDVAAVTGEGVRALGDVGAETWESFQGFWNALNDAVPGFSGLGSKDMIDAALNIADLVDGKVPFLGAVLSAAGSVDLIGRTLDGRASLTDWIVQGGDLLTSAPNPAVKLFGLNVQMWSMVGEEAAKADFSGGAVRDTFAYAAGNLDVVTEEVGKATAYVGMKFFNMLKF